MSGPRGRLEPVTTPDPQSSEVPVADLGYEQARDELVRVVTALESGGATLEETLALWERGNALAARCEEWLQGAKARLEAARSSASAADGASGSATAAGSDRADEA